MKRVILDLLFLIIVIACPWWVSVLFGIAVLYYFKTYYEVIIFGLLLDIYYGHFSTTFHLQDYRFTILFVVLWIFSHYIKKRLKFYAR